MIEIVALRVKTYAFSLLLKQCTKKQMLIENKRYEL